MKYKEDDVVLLTNSQKLPKDFRGKTAKIIFVEEDWELPYLAYVESAKGGHNAETYKNANDKVISNGYKGNHCYWVDDKKIDKLLVPEQNTKYKAGDIVHTSGVYNWQFNDKDAEVICFREATKSYLIYVKDATNGHNGGNQRNTAHDLVIKKGYLGNHCYWIDESNIKKLVSRQVEKPEQEPEQNFDIQEGDMLLLRDDIEIGKTYGESKIILLEKMDSGKVIKDVRKIYRKEKRFIAENACYGRKSWYPFEIIAAKLVPVKKRRFKSWR